jgi:hypothetical protein
VGNSFNSAKMSGAQDKNFQKIYNYLIDLLSAKIQILTVALINGLTVTNGVITLGNELIALQDLVDTAGFIKKTGDGTYAIDATNFQPLDGTLTSISAINATVSNNFIVSNGADSWTNKTLAETKSILGISTVIQTKTGDYTAGATDRIIRFTASATLTLPAATGSGWQYIIICDGSGISVVVDANGTETINRQLTQTLSDGDCMVIYDTASGIWNIG